MDMLNAVKSMLADISSVSPFSEQRGRYIRLQKETQETGRGRFRERSRRRCSKGGDLWKVTGYSVHLERRTVCRKLSGHRCRKMDL